MCKTTLIVYTNNSNKSENTKCKYCKTKHYRKFKILLKMTIYHLSVCVNQNSADLHYWYIV